MDPQTDLPDLVEDLEVNIDELSATLTPLLPPNTLSKTSASLPLLEKAKLYVLAAYAIESVLFSTLQAAGADAKAHALFAELARLKAYFGKIKDAEESAAGPTRKLDVGAAQRFIRHGLSGNERYDELRKERVVREKERALEKARRLTNRKFSDDEGTPKKRAVGGEAEGTPKKKTKVDEAVEEDENDVDTPAALPAKRGRKAKTVVKGEQEEGDDSTPAPTQDSPPNEAMDVDSPVPAKKKRGRPSKKDKSASAHTPQKAAEESTPARATRSSAGAAGSSATTKGKGKGKSRGKAK